MPKTRSPSVLGSGRVLYLPTARIRPNPMQPRKHFDTGGLQELAGSIRQYGVLQPLTVRKAGGAYELVAGRAPPARARGWPGLTEVPCLLADVDEEASGMLALVENLQRRDLDYIEEAEGLQKAHAAVPSEPGAGCPPHRQEPVRRRKQAAHPAPSAVRSAGAA